MVDSVRSHGGPGAVDGLQHRPGSRVRPGPGGEPRSASARIIGQSGGPPAGEARLARMRARTMREVLATGTRSRTGTPSRTAVNRMAVADLHR